MVTPNQRHSPDEIEIKEGSLAEQLIAEKADFSAWLQGLLKMAPYLLISALFVSLMLGVMAMVILSAPNTRIDDVVEILMPQKKQPDLEMELPRDIFDNKNLPKDIPSDQDPVWKDAEVSDHNETADEEDFQESKGDSMDFLSDKPLKGAGVYDSIGVGGGAGGRYGGPRGGRRNLVSRGGGAMTESAVAAGLLWLARHQNPNGSWGCASFQNQCPGTKCEGTGEPQFDIGLTGLCLLAFTGAGYHNMSRDTFGGINFGEVVRKAATFLMDIQEDNGAFGTAQPGKFMYNHSVAAYAMADLYGLTMDTGSGVLFQEPVQNAIDYLVSVQNPGKAWCYNPKDGQNDTSVSGWCIMALKAAENAELNVPHQAFIDTKSFYDDVTDDAYGRVGYIEKGTVAVRTGEKIDPENIPPSMTAVGVMVRIFIDKNTNDSRIKNGINLILSQLPEWDSDTLGVIDYYYWFYATYCLNQYDGPNGPAWKKWNNSMKSVLLKSQKSSSDGHANGSWDAIDRWSEEVGRVYATAINVLTLEVYYRLGIVTRMGH